MTHINPNHAGGMLYDCGISYHGSAIYSKTGTRQIYGIGFKCDKLTDAQRTLLSQYENVEIKTIQAQYAPELIKPLIMVKTMAQMRRERSK